MADKNKALICDCLAIDEAVVKKVKKSMPSEDKIIDMAEFFSVFGDGTRVKILCALTRSEMCVCDISFLLNMTKSSVSHQLRILKQARLVKYRKEGKKVFYSLCDDHVKSIIEQGFEHIGELYV
ncbi:MAG: metalloregulator ArsR/SmtB family transcription factor [Elusimicrobiota bacterium]|jgi:ArsR family transcriptional regulator|nr:metalloregulator ArsR/SmtB family transcription factor [Elusimicrobiota bacterium]